MPEARRQDVASHVRNGCRWLLRERVPLLAYAGVVVLTVIIGIIAGTYHDALMSAVR